MTERPTDQTQTRPATRAPGAPTSSPTPYTPPGGQPQGQQNGRPAAQTGGLPSRQGRSTGQPVLPPPPAPSEDTAERPVPLAERIQQKLSSLGSSRNDDTARVPVPPPSGAVATPPSAPAAPAASTTTTRTTKGRAPARRPRRARLRMTRIDPWSVMKTSFLLAIAFGVVTVVAVFMVWSVLGAAGVWDSINRTIQDIVGPQSQSTFDIKDYVGMSRIMGFTMVIAVVDVVLITAIATLSAFLYNMASALLGGIEVTLAEDA